MLFSFFKFIELFIEITILIIRIDRGKNDGNFLVCNKFLFQVNKSIQRSIRRKTI